MFWALQQEVRCGPETGENPVLPDQLSLFRNCLRRRQRPINSTPMRKTAMPILVIAAFGVNPA
jgi:hypothetical protein